MKLFARLHLVVLLAISALVYMAWSLRSYHPITRAKKVWSHTTTHIVVFGDSWSTNRLAAVPANQSAPVDKLWVDALCAEVVCDHIYDFGQSLPSDPFHRRGPVLNNEIYANETNSLNITSVPEEIADFKDQVDQFLTQEYLWGEVDQEKGQTSMIITVFFGIWEIWDYVALDQASIMRAIFESIGSLFVELDRLMEAKSVSSLHPTIVIPKVPDPTFFPRWTAQRTALNGSDAHGQLQRQAVILTELWNKVLEKHVAGWNKADVVMPDFNQWMLDQMRKPEIEENGLTALWKSRSGTRFTELTQPCVHYTASSEQNSLEARPFVRCRDPSRYLFWDDTRLSGAAHESLGKYVAQVLRNSTGAS